MVDSMLIEGFQLWVYRGELQAFLRQHCRRWPPAASDPKPPISGVRLSGALAAFADVLDGQLSEISIHFQLAVVGRRPLGAQNVN